MKSEFLQHGFGIRMLSTGIDINYFCAAWHMLGHYFCNNSTRVAQAIISAAITVIMVILITVIRSVLCSAHLSRARHTPALSSPLCLPHRKSRSPACGAATGSPCTVPSPWSATRPPPPSCPAKSASGSSKAMNRSSKCRRQSSRWVLGLQVTWPHF